MKTKKCYDKIFIVNAQITKNGGINKKMNKGIAKKSRSKSKFYDVMTEVWKYRFIYFLLLPATVLVIMFSYIPMVGIKMAFQDYNVYDPAASTWVGLQNFKELFQSSDSIASIMNTFKISIWSLIVSFPLTVIFALLLNELRNKIFKKVIQTVSYLPYFLSWISVIGIVSTLYSTDGIINDMLAAVMGNAWQKKSLLSIQGFFIPDVIILSTWKTLGWGSIVFLAAITGIDQTLYEAAMLDGAGKLKQVIHITIPGILPTIMIMLLWRIAALFGDNFELIYGLQNPFVNVEVIGTLIYKNGIAGGNYQMTTAFGLMQGLVNFIFLIGANWLSKKGADVGIF